MRSAHRLMVGSRPGSLLGPAGPASAHGGDGRLEVVSRTESGALRVEYVVMLTHVNDGDPGTDATVTLTASVARAARP